MLKRIFSVVLAVSTIIVSFAGCGILKKTSDNTSFETAPKIYFAKNNTYEKMFGNTGDDPADNEYVRYIYEKTGVRLVPVLLASTQTEADQQLAIKRASGEQIDLLIQWNMAQQYMQSGLIIPLNDFFKKNSSDIKGYSPYDKDGCIPETAWRSARKADTYWAIPSRSTLPEPSITTFFIRKDWLDKLGLKMPTNTNELGGVMKAFTENDPDGNGKKDTWGMAHNGNNTVFGLLLYLGIDTNREFIVDDNGKITDNGTKLLAAGMTDRARKAYELIRSWNKQGYINDEGVVDTNAYARLISNNKVGIYLGSVAPTTLLQYRQNLKENGYKDAEWVMSTNKIKSSIDDTFYGWCPALNQGNQIMLTSMAKESSYKDIVKLLNWMYSEEGTTFQSYGFEGKEYNMKDGNRVLNDDYLKKSSYLGLYSFGKSYKTFFKDQAYRTYGEDEFGKLYVDEMLEHNKEYYTVRTDIKFEYPDLPEFTMYPDWLKGIDTYKLKFVVGDEDPADDATWNKYLNECNSYGIQKLMDAAAKKYFGK